MFSKGSRSRHGVVLLLGRGPRKGGRPLGLMPPIHKWPTVDQESANGCTGLTPAVRSSVRERPESALCSRWLTTRRMGEHAPKPSFAGG
jgi:hypothetical protein